jgi:ABC-2 type transport system permease protein
VRALVMKELWDLQRNRAVFFPAVLTGVLAMLMPFFIAVLVPHFSGERLSDSADFRVATEMYARQPGSIVLQPEGAIQAWIFQQFLLLLMISPIAGAMSVAAHTVIGEKQARTLEPILATPITTRELLAAKVLGSLLPSLALGLLGFALYVGLVAIFAEPGVALFLLVPRSLGVVLIISPLAALAALQMAVCVSSRVNDARTAQQIGALIILPITGLLIAQLTGNVQLTGRVLAAIAAALVVMNVVLVGIGVRLFDRESILTRWK